MDWYVSRATFAKLSNKSAVPVLSGLLTGFGIFSVKQSAARTGRNPRTGETVDVTAKRVPYFKPGKEMRARLNVE